MRLSEIASIAALSCALALCGCASGGGGQRDGGTGGGGRDGGTRRDSGEFSGCDPRGWAGTCQMATDLGMLMSGGRIESEIHLIERRAGAQWAQIRFPLEPPPPPMLPDGAVLPDGGAPSMHGGGTPRIRFLRNDADAYRMEIRTACTAVAGCGEGSEAEMATNITEWSITDDPAMSVEGPGQLSTRNTPWPETLYLRVYAAEDPECGRYQIEITR